MMDKKERQAIYNAASNMRRSVLNFGKFLCRDLKYSHTRFVSEMLFGMMSAQDVKLTKIDAALGEEYPLKSTVEWLYRNLSNFDDGEILHNRYMKKVTKRCREDTLFTGKICA